LFTKKKKKKDEYRTAISKLAEMDKFSEGLRKAADQFAREKDEAINRNLAEAAQLKEGSASAAKKYEEEIATLRKELEGVREELGGAREQLKELEEIKNTLKERDESIEAMKTASQASDAEKEELKLENERLKNEKAEEASNSLSSFFFLIHFTEQCFCFLFFCVFNSDRLRN
jgi:DNA repair exonuclease SbcCD ATPase subunit